MTPLASPPRLVEANGVSLCVQTFGDAAALPLLLIAGGASSMDWWEDELCERLAAGPRFVIRYDLRDTGQSVAYAPGAPGYSGSDLVADAVGILDTLGVARAHVVGMSMGGGIAQHLALDHPERVATLTLISTSPVGLDVPLTDDEERAGAQDPVPEPDWTDRDAVIEHLVADVRSLAGRVTIDDEKLRALVAKVVDRTIDMRSTMTNHWLLEGGGGDVRLGEVTAPTLVLHGTEDPLFPFGHGEALAREIPGARLVPLEGVGHEYPPRDVWEELVGYVLEHTAEREG